MSYLHWAPVTEGLLEAVWVVDPQTLRILSANSAASQLLGVAREVLVGSAVLDWIADPQDEVYWAEWRAGIEQTLDSETTVRRADGSVLRVQRRVGPVHPVGSEPVVLVAMQNLAEWQATHQQLETLLAELRSVLESASDGILVCDLDGRIRAFNPAFARLWDLPDGLLTDSDEQGVWQHLATRVTDAGAFQARLQELQRTPLREAHDLVPLRTGRLLERTSRPQLARGRPIGRIYVYRDITEQAAIDAKLRLAAKVFEAAWTPSSSPIRSTASSPATRPRCGWPNTSTTSCRDSRSRPCCRFPTARAGRAKPAPRCSSGATGKASCGCAGPGLRRWRCWCRGCCCATVPASR